MPMIPGQIDNDNILIQALYLNQILRRPVRGAVIHEYHFKRYFHIFKNTPHAAVKLIYAQGATTLT